MAQHLRAGAGSPHGAADRRQGSFEPEIDAVRRNHLIAEDNAVVQFVRCDHHMLGLLRAIGNRLLDLDRSDVAFDGRYDRMPGQAGPAKIGLQQDADLRLDEDPFSATTFKVAPLSRYMDRNRLPIITSRPRNFWIAKFV